MSSEEEEWEDGDLNQESSSCDEGDEIDDGELVLDLDSSSVVESEPTIQKRKGRNTNGGVSKADKAIAMDMHRVHLLTLTARSFLVDSWCQDEMVRI